MFNLKRVKLDPADQTRLRDLNDKTQGVQRMVQMFVESGERRVAELQAQGRALYADLAQKYDLDLKHVNYAPSEDGTELVPIQVMLANG